MAVAIRSGLHRAERLRKNYGYVILGYRTDSIDIPPAPPGLAALRELGTRAHTYARPVDIVFVAEGRRQNRGEGEAEIATEKEREREKVYSVT